MNWVKTADHYVQPQVKLEAVDEERLVQVPLHDTTAALHALGELIQLLEEHY